MTKSNQPDVTADAAFESIRLPTLNPTPTIERIKKQPIVEYFSADQDLAVEQMQQSTYWDWQTVAANTVNEINTLASLIGVDGQALASLVEMNNFKLRVPLPFVSRMQTGDLSDLLLLQVLPLKQEQQNISGNSADPLDEKRYNVCPGLVHGLVHKYRGRVLLTAATSLSN